jgi:hypothetical protein
MEGNMENMSAPTRDEVEAALADPEPESEAPELNVLTPEERTIGAKILPGLTARIRAKAEAASAQALADKIVELQANNTRMMNDEVTKLRASLQPPDQKQIEQLLSQEYATMDVQVWDRKHEKRSFTLRELPQSAEKKMFEIISVKVVPHLKELAAVEWAVSASNAERLEKVISIIPDGLDMLAQVCAICMDPYKEEGIDAEWIQNTMGSNRIINVIEAQMEISKLRDFGSAVYRLLPRR